MTGPVCRAAGFSHFKYHRYYDSAIGRYTQVDPLASAGIKIVDLYSYAGGNPVTRTDRSGLIIDTTGAGSEAEAALSLIRNDPYFAGIYDRLSAPDIYVRIIEPNPWLDPRVETGGGAFILLRSQDAREAEIG